MQTKKLIISPSYSGFGIGFGGVSLSSRLGCVSPSSSGFWGVALFDSTCTILEINQTDILQETILLLHRLFTYHNHKTSWEWEKYNLDQFLEYAIQP